MFLQDVFILDTGLQVFVWVGGDASPAEKKNGFSYAQVCKTLVIFLSDG